MKVAPEMQDYDEKELIMLLHMCQGDGMFVTVQTMPGGVLIAITDGQNVYGAQEETWEAVIEKAWKLRQVLKGGW